MKRSRLDSPAASSTALLVASHGVLPPVVPASDSHEKHSHPSAAADANDIIDAGQALLNFVVDAWKGSHSDNCYTTCGDSYNLEDAGVFTHTYTVQ